MFAKANMVGSTHKAPIIFIRRVATKVGKTVALKTKSKMWDTIRDKLAAKGYNFTLTQIESYLERQYKKTNLHNKKTGRNKETCQYQRYVLI